MVSRLRPSDKKSVRAAGSCMHSGVAMFLTEDAMRPGAPLARAVEERGFESLWFTEHSDIPLARARSGAPGRSR